MPQHIIKIPADLASALDFMAGHKRRTAYAIDVLWKEVRRNRQKLALLQSAGAWSDHPELAGGAAAYVDQIRAEPDERFEAAIRRQDR